MNSYIQRKQRNCYMFYSIYGILLKAYYNIRFEKEAYAHQNDMEYLIRRKHYCYLKRIEARHI